jgi:hypothetical protein
MDSNLFDKGIWDEPSWWLCEIKEKVANKKPEKENAVFNSGYVILHNNKSWGLLRFPYFRFRPSHNDVFHFDLWCNGVNILCDAGSFSYNPPLEYDRLNLKSVHSHNTVSFDKEEQMPDLSRFLMGKWLKPDRIGEIETITDGIVSWEGSYADNQANKHIRRISVLNHTWCVEDALSGNFKKAEIGFNINDPDCTFENNKIITSFGIITFPAGSEVCLEEKQISEYYNELRTIRRLKNIISRPGIYRTVIQLNS